MIVHYLTQISPSLVSSKINIPTLVGLAIAMNLLRPHQVTMPGGGIEIFLVPSDPASASRPFHHSRLLYLEGQRAAHASVLLAIPESKAVIDQIRKIA